MARVRVQIEEATYRYRWVILGVVWLGYTSIWVQRLSIPPLSTFLRSELSFSHTQIGLLVSAPAFAFVAVQLLSGWFVDRFGIRLMMLIYQVMGGISLLGMSRINSFTSAVVFMSLVGFWCGGLTPATTKGVIDWFPQKERATVMGFKQTGVNIGGVVMASTLPVLALSWSWRGCFLFIGALVIAFGLISFAFYRNPPEKIVPEARASASTEAAAASSKKALWKVLLGREMLCLSFGSLFISCIEFGVIAHLAVYLNEVKLFSAVVAGLGLAVMEGSGAFGKPLAGLLSDRVFGGSRRKPFVLMAFLACVLLVALMLVSQAMPVWVLFPVLVLLGLSAASWAGLWLTLVGEFAGKKHTATAAGFSTMIVALGSSIGPLIFGYLVDQTGSYQPAWLFMAISAAICGTLVFLVREGKRVL